VAILSHFLKGAYDLAIVVNGKIGKKGGLEWMTRKIKTLVNLSPLEYLDDPVLILRLRQYLIELLC